MTRLGLTTCFLFLNSVGVQGQSSLVFDIGIDTMLTEGVTVSQCDLPEVLVDGNDGVTRCFGPAAPGGSSPGSRGCEGAGAGTLGAVGGGAAGSAGGGAGSAAGAGGGPAEGGVAEPPPTRFNGLPSSVMRVSEEMLPSNFRRIS